MKKQIYEKKGYTVYEYYFENLHRFLEYITTEETNTRVFNPRRLSSMKDSYSFNRTNSLDEAIRLCATGWDEKFSLLLKLKDEVDEKFLHENQLQRRVKDCVGFAPSVPDYLHGNPVNMWNRIYEPNCEIINIYVNIAYSHSTNTSAVYNRGAIILSLVDALERMGYGVNLTVFEYCYERSEAFLAYFNIKDETENLNMKKAYFPLCHPSFLRRLGFRLKEVTPFRYSDWEDSYGMVPDRHEVVRFFDFDLTRNILFSTPKQMGIEGDDIYEDLSTVLSSIKIGDLKLV
ncbi:MAG: hypothetical protein Q4D02_03875 [Clostridia bacterium]|nr:hypothetical protein [Clostridia bacterium]